MDKEVLQEGGSWISWEVEAEENHIRSVRDDVIFLWTHFYFEMIALNEMP